MTALFTGRRVRVLLYNDQTVSPITNRIRAAAERAGIPVVGVSETMPPRRQLPGMAARSGASARARSAG